MEEYIKGCVRLRQVLSRHVIWEDDIDIIMSSAIIGCTVTVAVREFMLKDRDHVAELRAYLLDCIAQKVKFIPWVAVFR